MDSVSQLALGASVAVAVAGRRVGIGRAACWGAVAGTLPDLDVFIDQGDPILDMVLHRAETHALFWLALASLPLVLLVARLHGQAAQWRRWWAALALALLTHPLLDAMTVYGTQLALPFSNHPYGLGSVFIIDPAYTLPLLLGLALALARRGPGGLRANAIGLALGCAYLGWSVLAQQMVTTRAQAALAAQGIAAERLLVTPTAFNTLLWRVVAIEGEHFHEGYASLLDAGPGLAFDRFARRLDLGAAVAGLDGVQRIQAFSKGFHKFSEEDGLLRITDLRMGQEPRYVFSFAVAERGAAGLHPLQPTRKLGRRPDLERGLPWLGRRLLGEPLPPPR